MDRRNLRVRKVSEKLAVVDEDERKRVSFLCLFFARVVSKQHMLQWRREICNAYVSLRYLTLIMSILAVACIQVSQARLAALENDAAAADTFEPRDSDDEFVLGGSDDGGLRNR